GIVSYNSVIGKVVGNLNTGNLIVYGDPSVDVTLKYWYAIDALAEGKVYEPLCGIETAAAQVCFIEKLQHIPIKQISEDMRLEREDGLVYIKDAAELLRRCYDEEKLLSETNEYKNW
ncbi:MAG: hypothetical protein J6I45_10380, partial [Clostridia bacterium]|nr:hypothetical protein [Clostridia bacterium]